jgi:hypothetical protein
VEPLAHLLWSRCWSVAMVLLPLGIVEGGVCSDLPSSGGRQNTRTWPGPGSIFRAGLSPTDRSTRARARRHVRYDMGGWSSSPLVPGWLEQPKVQDVFHRDRGITGRAWAAQANPSHKDPAGLAYALGADRPLGRLARSGARRRQAESSRGSSLR